MTAKKAKKSRENSAGTMIGRADSAETSADFGGDSAKMTELRVDAKKRSENFAKRSDLFDENSAKNNGDAETAADENAKIAEISAQNGDGNSAKKPEDADDSAENSMRKTAKNAEATENSAANPAKNEAKTSAAPESARSHGVFASTRARLFDRATVKLTLIYTSIIFAISLSFSCAIGVAAMGAANSPLNHPPIEVRFRDGTRASFDDIFRSRQSELNGNIVTDLVVLNAGILFFGAGLSFVLARKTLDPIETAMNEQADFVANASHELKTPLAVMQTENEVALRDDSAGARELRENLADNLREVKKLRQLTDYLLAMNAADRADVTLAESDLIEVIPAAVGRVSVRAEQKSVRISRKIAPEKIVTDAESLGEIVYILLDNAVKYAPDGTEVELVANAREISVRDHGGGIAEEDLPRLFERFYRGEKSHTSEGFGLGLALAETLADRIGARMAAENVREKGEIAGAKFTIKF